MNTQNTLSHDAAAQQVRAVIESLDREGVTPVVSRNPKADFRTVSISTGSDQFKRAIFLISSATFDDLDRFVT